MREALLRAMARVGAAPGADIAVRTGLARGADQVGAEEAFALGLAVQPFLPAAPSTYEAVLEADEALPGFRAICERALPVEVVANPPSLLRPRDYLDHARELVHGRDVVALVAVVDPRRPDAGPGGTEDAIREAVEAGIPVVTVEPATGRVDDDQGLVDDVRAVAEVLDPLEGSASDVAKAHKVAYGRRSLVLAAVSVVAVLLAALPVAVPDAMGPPDRAVVVGAAFALTELLLLGAALAYTLANAAASRRHPGGSVDRKASARAHWIEARTRWSLLRRERFLFVARVGPYALSGTRETSRPARLKRLRQRVQVLSTTRDEHFLGRAYEWAPMRPPEGYSAGPDGPEPVLVAWYRRARLVDQEDYFRRQGHGAHRSSRVWEGIAWGAVVAALVGVGLHLAMLLGGAPEVGVHEGGGGHHWWAQLGKLLTLVGPAAAAAASMVPSVQSVGSDAARYTAFAEVMRGLKDLPTESGFEAGAWVNQVEGLLLAEHVAWRAGMLAQDLKVG